MYIYLNQLEIKRLEEEKSFFYMYKKMFTLLIISREKNIYIRIYIYIINRFMKRN